MIIRRDVVNEYTLVLITGWVFRREVGIFQEKSFNFPAGCSSFRSEVDSEQLANVFRSGWKGLPPCPVLRNETSLPLTDISEGLKAQLDGFLQK